MRYRAEWASGYYVVWQDLSYKNYRKFSSRNKQTYENFVDFEIAHDVYKVCLIDGPDSNYVSFGIVQYIAKQQLIDNPFSGEEKPYIQALNGSRRVLSLSPVLAAHARIGAAFRYTMEEMAEWPPDVTFLRLAQTEVILGEMAIGREPAKKGKQGAPDPNASVQSYSVTAGPRRK